MRAQAVDPLRRREEFAVSLRRIKRKAIIDQKRKRIPNCMVARSETVAMTNLGLDQSMASSESNSRKNSDCGLEEVKSLELTN